jgi:hypothetical protein
MASSCPFFMRKIEIGSLSLGNEDQAFPFTPGSLLKKDLCQEVNPVTCFLSNGYLCRSTSSQVLY